MQSSTPPTSEALEWQRYGRYADPQGHLQGEAAHQCLQELGEHYLRQTSLPLHVWPTVLDQTHLSRLFWQCVQYQSQQGIYGQYLVWQSYWQSAVPLLYQHVVGLVSSFASGLLQLRNSSPSPAVKGATLSRSDSAPSAAVIALRNKYQQHRKELDDLEESLQSYDQQLADRRRHGDTAHKLSVQINDTSVKQLIETWTHLSQQRTKLMVHLEKLYQVCSIYNGKRDQFIKSNPPSSNLSNSTTTSSNGDDLQARAQALLAARLQALTGKTKMEGVPGLASSLKATPFTPDSISELWGKAGSQFVRTCLAHVQYLGVERPLTLAMVHQLEQWCLPDTVASTVPSKTEWDQLASAVQSLMNQVTESSKNIPKSPMVSTLPTVLHSPKPLSPITTKSTFPSVPFKSPLGNQNNPLTASANVAPNITIMSPTSTLPATAKTNVASVESKTKSPPPPVKPKPANFRTPSPQKQETLVKEEEKKVSENKASLAATDKIMNAAIGTEKKLNAANGTLSMSKSSVPIPIENPFASNNNLTEDPFSSNNKLTEDPFASNNALNENPFDSNNALDDPFAEPLEKESVKEKESTKENERRSTPAPKLQQSMRQLSLQEMGRLRILEAQQRLAQQTATPPETVVYSGYLSPRSDGYLTPMPLMTASVPENPFEEPLNIQEDIFATAEVLTTYRARVEKAFHSTNGLSLKPGQLVEVLSEPDAEGLVQIMPVDGTISGKCPVTFLQRLASTDPDFERGRMAVAVQDVKASEASFQLPLVMGQKIRVLNETAKDGWLPAVDPVTNRRGHIRLDQIQWDDSSNAVTNPFQRRLTLPHKTGTPSLTLPAGGVRRSVSFHSGVLLQATTPLTPVCTTPLEESTTSTANWSSRMDAATLATLSSDDRKRQEAIFELIVTERGYVRDLQLMLQLFYGPMQSMMNENDLHLIFSDSLEDMLLVNTQLLSALEARQQADGDFVQRVGDIFTDHVDAFDVYLKYCSNQRASSQFLQRRRQEDAALNEFLKERQRLPECRLLDLTSFLLQPMQRIARYPLLFKQILHYTPKTLPDHELLLHALESSENLLLRANEAARARENHEQLTQLQRRLVNPSLDLLSTTKLLGPRLFLRDGILHKAKSGRRLYVVLCNDLLLLMESAPGVVAMDDVTASNVISLSNSGGPMRRSRSLSKSAADQASHQAASRLTFYREPMPLHEVVVREGTLIRGQQQAVQADATTFQIVHIADIVNVRAASTADKRAWMNAIDQAAHSYRTKERSAKNNNTLSLSNAPRDTIGTLRVLIQGAKELAADAQTCRPYCVVQVNGQQQKTAVARQTTRSPVWQTPLLFSLATLDDVLRCTVYHYDRYSQNDYLGQAEMALDVLEYYGERETEQITLKLSDVPSGIVNIQLSYKKC